MNILPYEKFELRTALSNEDIQHRLTDSKLYKGKTSLNGFDLTQTFSYRSGVLPRIKGTIVDYPDERRIKVIIKLPSVGLILLSVLFLTFLGIAIHSFVTDSFSSSGDKSLEFFTISLIALLIGGTFVKYEIISSKRRLIKLLEAKKKPKK